MEELAKARESAKEEGADRRLPRRRAEALPTGEAEERADSGERHAVRFLVPEGETVWEDMVHEEMRFQNTDIDDLVILRSDGGPTYNLAVASDDAEHRITHVIRGDDHLSNTPKQILLYEALGHPVPTFGHVPMILGSDGKKGSPSGTAPPRWGNTRARASSLRPWSTSSPCWDGVQGTPGGDERGGACPAFQHGACSQEELDFRPEKVGLVVGPALQRQHGRGVGACSNGRIEAAGLATRGELEERREWYLSLIDLLKTRARRIPDLVDLARPFLVEELEFDPKAVAKHWLKAPAEVLEQLMALRTTLEAATWEPESLEEVIRGYAEEISVGAGKVIHPLRVAVTGRDASPGIFEVLAFLGRVTVLARLDDAIVRLASR